MRVLWHRRFGSWLDDHLELGFLPCYVTSERMLGENGRSFELPVVWFLVSEAPGAWNCPLPPPRLVAICEVMRENAWSGSFTSHMRCDS